MGNWFGRANAAGNGRPYSMWNDRNWQGSKLAALAEPERGAFPDIAPTIIKVREISLSLPPAGRDLSHRDCPACARPTDIRRGKRPASLGAGVARTPDPGSSL